MVNFNFYNNDDDFVTDDNDNNNIKKPGDSLKYLMVQKLFKGTRKNKAIPVVFYGGIIHPLRINFFICQKIN